MKNKSSIEWIMEHFTPEEVDEIEENCVSIREGRWKGRKRG